MEYDISLSPIADPAFFPEWQGSFADRSLIECTALDRSSRQYALSDKFTLSTIRDNQLIQVVQILMALVKE